MGITVRLTNKPKRKKYDPKVGDTKTVNGIEYVRVFKRVGDGLPHAGTLVVSNGRHLYEWKEVTK